MDVLRRVKGAEGMAEGYGESEGWVSGTAIVDLRIRFVATARNPHLPPNTPRIMLVFEALTSEGQGRIATHTLPLTREAASELVQKLQHALDETA